MHLSLHFARTSFVCLFMMRFVVGITISENDRWVPLTF